MKDQFLKAYKENITRPGADKLLKWLESSDFFNAPASTRFHLAEPGGLCKHSVHVYERLRRLVNGEPQVQKALGENADESVAIVGLLHDVCKVNFYSVEMRNRKNDSGMWERYPFYVVNDKLPYGHGEKSVYIISGFISLTRQESMAIRWHMGAWQDGEKQNAGAAFGQYPFAVLAHLADMQATYLDENNKA